MSAVKTEPRRREGIFEPMVRLGLNDAQEKDVLEKAQKMFNGVKQERTDYEPDWRENAKLFMPHMIQLDDSNQRSRASKWSNIVNNTCRMAVRTMQAGMQSGLTNKSAPWFKLGLEDLDLQEYGPAREWLEICTRRMQAILARTNFYTTASQLYGVIGTFGTAARLQIFDPETVTRFDLLMTGRYWIGIDARKRVDKLFYKKPMNVMQLVQEYGKRLPDNILQQYDSGNYDQTHQVIVGIFPNPYPGWDRSGMTLLAANQKKFVSVHWIEGRNDCLKTSGFDRFPAQVPRWERTSDECYGVGPGHDAIGDARSTQLKEREKAKGIKKMVSPPTSAPAEMRNSQFPISGLPGGVTYRPPNTNPDAISTLYEVKLPIQYLYQDIAIDEQRVNRAFYADLFLMLANSVDHDKTAFEVAQLKEEKLMALSPVIENLDEEFLDPSIERTFEQMIDNSIDSDNPIIPPPPPEIQNMTLKVEYLSVLAQAQQMVGIGSIQRLLQFTGNAAALFPERFVGDKLDLDEAVEQVGTMLGVPGKIIVSKDKVAEARDGRAQQMQQQQAAQLAFAGADAAAKLGKTPAGEGSILDAMTGQA